MTKASQHFGKDLSNFMRSPEAAEYMAALKSVVPTELTSANRGRYGGTWAHPKLAVFFARWLDVRFSVWCDAASGLCARESAVTSSDHPHGTSEPRCVTSQGYPA